MTTSPSPPAAAVSALAALRASTAALVQGTDAEKWTDEDVRAPSLLPDWTRGHVLTHIARNADGISRTISGALRGEVVARYADGREGRDADIEAGAARSSTELFADVRESAERLDRVLAAVADADAWALPTEDRAVAMWLPARVREVEVHRVDLGGTYTAADWPPQFVSELLPDLVDGLAARASSALHIEIATQGSSAPDLAGRTWTVGDATPTQVTGPDWAVLAWLIGRPEAALNQLSAAPSIDEWI